MLDSLSADRWFPPIYRGQPYFGKPPLGFWLQGFAVRLFGDDEWVFRLLPALASFFALAAFAIWVARICHPLVAALGTAVLSSGPQLLFRHGMRQGVFEGSLLLAVALVLVSTTVRSRLMRSILWIVAGIAGSLKGGAFPALALFCYWLLRLSERRGGIGSHSGVFLRAGALSSLVWCSQWLALLGAVNLESLLRSFSAENLARFAGTVPDSHRGSWTLGPLVLWREYGLWLVLVPLGVAGVLKHGPPTSKIGARGALTVALLPLLFLLVSPARLAWYLYPSFLGWSAWIALGGHMLGTFPRNAVLRTLLGALLAWCAADRFDARWPRLVGWRPELVPERVVSDALRTQTACRPVLDLDFDPSRGKIREWRRFYLESRLQAIALRPDPDESERLIVFSESPSLWEQRLAHPAKQPTRVPLDSADPNTTVFVIDACGGAYARLLRTLPTVPVLASGNSG